MDQIKREFQSPPPLVTSRQSLTVTATKTEMMETSSRMETSPRKNIKVETSSEDSPRKQQLKKPAEIKSEARQAQLSEAQSDSSTAATGTQQSPRTSKHRRSTTAQRRARRKSKSAEPETDPSASGTGYIRIPIQRPKADVSYAEARKYLDDPMVAETVEHRHITLGWQHAGHIERTINHLLGVTVGQYRASVGGVCMAIGEVRILKPMFIIDYHNCMHVDVDVHMIVFKVQPGEPLQLDGEKQIRCQCQAITSDYAVLGTAYGNLGMCCNPAPAGVNIGDYFMARLKAVNFKQSLCQIEVQPLSIRRFAD